jgi:glycosyltransferase involved in cell wall biosynthesis
MKNILFIAPLPPPVDGQSKASNEALNALQSMGCPIKTINTARASLKRNIFTQLSRCFEVLFIFIKIAYFSSSAKSIYLSLSESRLGNIKDILTYIILYPKLNRITLHMLGGSGMDVLLNKLWLTSRVNGFFMKRMRGVIVEGKRGYGIFGRYFENENITIVPNFVDDYLHVHLDDVKKKFCDYNNIQVLYLSNLLPGKGYMDLLDAYLMLSKEEKHRIRLKFVGGFSCDGDRDFFLKKIASIEGVEYLGAFIDGELKKKLYLQSHIFCLPTYYLYEGQPISILEAYATGCFVMTTNHGGISDVFTNSVNGCTVLPRNPNSIEAALRNIINDEFDLKEVALGNMREAGWKYRSSTYRERIVAVFSSLSND